MVDFVKLESTLPVSAEDELAGWLSRLPILGIQIESYGDDRVRAEVWVRGDDELIVNEVREVLAGYGSGDVRRIEQADQDWSSEWRAGLRAFSVGDNWWIEPHPEMHGDAPDGRFRLVVEPRAAFGSGTHESTRLVLLELESMDCRDLRVLDVGTGSGILAVAAERRGAAVVVALDTDSMAAWEARHTVRVQQPPSRSLIVAGGVECIDDGNIDIVLCNMISAEFAPILGDIRRVLSANGAAVFSGILECELSDVRAMLTEHGLEPSSDRVLGGWISVCARRGGIRS